MNDVTHMSQNSGLRGGIWTFEWRLSDFFWTPKSGTFEWLFFDPKTETFEWLVLTKSRHLWVILEKIWVTFIKLRILSYCILNFCYFDKFCWYKWILSAFYLLVLIGILLKKIAQNGPKSTCSAWWVNQKSLEFKFWDFSWISN